MDNNNWKSEPAVTKTVKIILISNGAEKVRTLSLNSWAKGLLSVLLLGIPVAAGTLLGVKIADGRWELVVENTVNQMQHELVQQQQEVDQGRAQAAETLTAMTVKLAEMRARLIRLDALGERLTQIARLDDGEFDLLRRTRCGWPKGIIGRGDDRLTGYATRTEQPV